MFNNYPPPYHYGPPQNGPTLRDIEDALKFYEGLKETLKKEADEKKKKDGPKPKGISAFDMFLLMTIFSPLIGWAYGMFLNATFANLKDVLQKLAQ